MRGSWRVYWLMGIQREEKKRLWRHCWCGRVTPPQVSLQNPLLPKTSITSGLSVSAEESGREPFFSCCQGSLILCNLSLCSHDFFVILLGWVLLRVLGWRVLGELEGMTLRELKPRGDASSRREESSRTNSDPLTPSLNTGPSHTAASWIDWRLASLLVNGHSKRRELPLLIPLPVAT